MPTNLTIIGLGQIGSSIGLALAQYKESIRRTGHDLRPDAWRTAHEKGAVDAVQHNLPASVRDADIVLLAVPHHEVGPIFEHIAEELKPGALVMDTAAIKGTIPEIAAQTLKADTAYIGLVPSIGPDHLLDIGTGFASARADLFKESVFLVCPGKGASEASVKLATDLLELLGATPMFSDFIEADGIMSALHTLPELLGLALLDATTRQTGWKEARKLAGRPYALASASVLYQDEAEAVRSSALANSENTLRVLDNAIASLQKVRAALASYDHSEAENVLDDAYLGGMQWLRDRLGADWMSEEVQKVSVPNFRERMSQTFLGNWLTPDKRK